jgi:hypothetical protein
MNDLVASPKAKISAAEMQVRLEAVQQADANHRINGQFSTPKRMQFSMRSSPEISVSAISCQ